MALGIIYKVITRAGAYYSYGDRKWQGADALVTSIREEIDLKDALDIDVRSAVKSSSKFIAEERGFNG